MQKFHWEEFEFDKEKAFPIQRKGGSINCERNGHDNQSWEKSLQKREII